MNCKNAITHLTFCISLFCIASISSCKQDNDNKPEVQSITQDTTQNTVKIQNELVNITDDTVNIDSITFDFTHKKGVFLDSIQLYSCETSDGENEYFFHFYCKDSRYSYEIYFSPTYYGKFSFDHMNKDKYLDLVFDNPGQSGQGWWVSNIFLLEPKSKKYILKNVLSSPGNIKYNRKFDVYSGYSRGSGQAGPWTYGLFKYENDSLICFESLFTEREVICLDPLCSKYRLDWKYTHFCNGDTVVYKNLKESEVRYHIDMCKYFKPNLSCQFISSESL